MRLTGCRSSGGVGRQQEGAKWCGCGALTQGGTDSYTLLALLLSSSINKQCVDFGTRTRNWRRKKLCQEAFNENGARRCDDKLERGEVVCCSFGGCQRRIRSSSSRTPPPVVETQAKNCRKNSTLSSSCKTRDPSLPALHGSSILLTNPGGRDHDEEGTTTRKQENMNRRCLVWKKRRASKKDKNRRTTTTIGAAQQFVPDKL